MSETKMIYKKRDSDGTLTFVDLGSVEVVKAIGTVVKYNNQKKVWLYTKNGVTVEFDFRDDEEEMVNFLNLYEEAMRKKYEEIKSEK